MREPNDDDDCLPSDSHFRKEIRARLPLSRKIMERAKSLELAPDRYLEMIYRKEKILSIDQGIVAIFMTWAPLWLLFLALAISPQGQDLLNHFNSDLLAAAMFIGALCVLCVVATFVATTLVGAWHFPRVAKVSMERENLYVPTIPKDIPRLTDFEREEIIWSARWPIIISIGMPLALLSVAALRPLEWQIGTALLFIAMWVLFGIAICFFVWCAVRWLYPIIVCSYLLLLLALAGLMSIGLAPVLASHFATTTIAILLVAVFWLLIFFGITFQLYSGRHNDASKLPTWVPTFVRNHARLLGAVLLYLMFAVIVGYVRPYPTPWMIATDAAQGSSGDRQPLLQLDQAFDQFEKLNKELHKDKKRPTLVLVTAAGGGIRAAYWSAVVLSTLQGLRSDFDRHIFAISAVSGGALGASTYKALTLQRSSGCADTKKYRDCAAQFLGGDFIGPNIIAASTGEVLESVLRGLLPFTARDDALELAWSRQWWSTAGDKDVSFEGPFDHLFRSRPTPALLLNGMSMVSGHRVITSNLDVTSFAADSDQGVSAVDLCIVDREIVNPAKYLRLSVASAVLTSARFPYITPPGLLSLPSLDPSQQDEKKTSKQGRKCRNWEQIVDGGYIDNEGILSMRDLLNKLMVLKGGSFSVGAKVADDESARRFGRAYRVVVIRISSEPSRRKEQSYDPPDRDKWNQLFSAALNQLAAAGQTLVRDFRRQIEQSLNGCWIEINALDDDAPLGWTLSKDSRKRLDAWLDGPSSPTWNEVYRGANEKGYEAIRVRAVETNLPIRLQLILNQLDDEDAPCAELTL